MNRNWVSFTINRHSRAVLTAIAFVAVLFGGVALMDWAESHEPFWLKLLVTSAAAVVVGAAITLFFRKAPKVL